MTPEQEIILSIVPGRNSQSATTQEIRDAIVKKYGKINNGRTSIADYVYARLNSMERLGLVEAERRGKGTPVEWKRSDHAKDHAND